MNTVIFHSYDNTVKDVNTVLNDEAKRLKGNFTVKS